MTTLYKPVLIEYEEQAEVLPIGTVGCEPPHLYAYIKRARNHWQETGHDGSLTDYEMVPFTALVPTEAEEEWTAMGSDYGDPWIAHVGHDGIDGSREEAEAYTRRFGGFVARRAFTPWEGA